MDTFPLVFDLMRLTFLLGAVLALIYKKKLGVTPGGIIVPGFLAVILFTSFVAFLIVLVTTGITMLVYKVFFSKYALSKRWSSLLIISLSVAISLGAAWIVEGMALMGAELLVLSVIMPGLITISSQKYGHQKVIFGTLFVTAVTGVLNFMLALAIPNHLLTKLSIDLAVYDPMTLDNPYIVLPVSLAFAIFAYYKFGIRGGGYLIAPFLIAVLVASPFQALLFGIGIVASYFAIRYIQKHTLVIGLERFVISLFLGYIVVTLIDIYAVLYGIEGYTTAPIVLIIALAVLTNDLSLQPPLRTIKKGIAPASFVSLLTRLAV